MLTITDTAAGKLADYMKTQGRGKGVRIKLAPGS